jgi:hypothetical protein
MQNGINQLQSRALINESFVKSAVTSKAEPDHQSKVLSDGAKKVTSSEDRR